MLGLVHEPLILEHEPDRNALPRSPFLKDSFRAALLARTNLLTRRAHYRLYLFLGHANLELVVGLQADTGFSASVAAFVVVTTVAPWVADCPLSAADWQAVVNRKLASR
jgi:hypothetical protein